MAKSEHLAQLDGLRAFAVGAVVFYHYVPASHQWFLGGRYGVRLFFVISGFLITRILLGMRAGLERGEQSLGFSLRQFYIRRFLRIFPLYYAVLFATALLNVPDVRSQLGWHLTYLSNVLFSLRGYAGYASHFWSLSVEEQFYLVWPLVILAVPRRHLAPLMLACVAVGPLYRLVAVVIGVHDPATWILTPACLDALALGALLAHTWQLPNEAPTRMLARVALVAGVIVVAATVAADLAGPAARFRFVTSDLAAALLFTWTVAAAARGFRGLAGRLLEWRPVAYIGKISYGIYVYHFILPYFAYRIPAVQHARGWVVLPVMTLASIAISALSWELFESRINALKDHFPYLARPRTHMPAAASEPGQAALQALPGA